MLSILDKITVNAQSSIRIDAGLILRFDPFMLEESPLDADVIFITHAHHDHFSAADIEKAAKADTVFVAPAGMKRDLAALGIDAARMVLLQPGDKAAVRGIPVEAVPSYNTNKPMHPKRNGWLGYVVTVDDTRVYVTGDMDDNPDGRAVECDVLMLPIGGTYTMNAAEAAAFTNAVSPRAVIPTHYGSIVGKPTDAAAFRAGLREGIDVCVKL